MFPLKQTEKIRYEFVASPDELFGHIMMTQTAIALLASYLGKEEKLREDLLLYNSRKQKSGLIYSGSGSNGERITQADLPDLFRGMNEACEQMVDLIKPKTKLPSESSAQRT